MSNILDRRLRYYLSPQWDIYKSIAPHVAGKNVIEIGFGTGLGTTMISQSAATVYAVDSDPGLVALAQDLFPMRNVNWLHKGVDDLPADDFDAAVMIEVLEHVPDWRGAMHNVWNSLAPGGKLYISARNANADLRKNELHEREWTAGQFRNAMLEYFKDVRLWDYTLSQQQDTNTRMTPLIAVATK